MPLSFYNTISRKKEPFSPLDPDRVTMYVCGPTVYAHPHIGNARPAVVFDVLFRVLKSVYPNVVYARNITDIEDKIYAAAKQQGVDISVITDKYTRIFHRDMRALGVQPPTIEPRATDHIAPMIEMIERLISQGYAYEAQGHVLFSVSAYENYGRLSGRNREDMIAGARVEVAPYKKDPADFVLWKPSTDDLPGWHSPWGRGRPGWHLECSAMSEMHLGNTIDIHAGGHDLIFPHHENEIAQSTCSHGGQLFARYWLHNGFVNVDAEKMSKSIGNVLLVDELLQHEKGETIRLVLLSTHYRKPMDWTQDAVNQARRNLDRLYGALRDNEDIPVLDKVEIPADYLAALYDDLNTPLAISRLLSLARALNSAGSPDEKKVLKSQLIQAAQLIGLLSYDVTDWFSTSAGVDIELVEKLIEKRNLARSQKDYQKADAIREELAQLSVEIEDTQGETRWRRTRK